MSDSSLNELIIKVKSEAIETAEKEAQQIIDNARKKAENHLKQAEDKKNQLLEEAQTEAEATLNKGEIALKQAARDVQLSVKNDLHKLFKSVLAAEIKAAFTPELYAAVITKLIDNVGSNVEIALPDNLQEEVIAAIQKKITEANQSAAIVKKQQLFSGLSVTKTDEGWSYDITAEEVSELLNQHLSAKWVQLLNKK